MATAGPDVQERPVHRADRARRHVGRADGHLGAQARRAGRLHGDDAGSLVSGVPDTRRAVEHRPRAVARLAVQRGAPLGPRESFYVFRKTTPEVIFPTAPTTVSAIAASALVRSRTSVPARNATAPASTIAADHGYPQARNGRGVFGSRRLSAKSARQQTQ